MDVSCCDGRNSSTINVRRKIGGFFVATLPTKTVGLSGDSKVDVLLMGKNGMQLILHIVFGRRRRRRFMNIFVAQKLQRDLKNSTRIR